MKEIEAKFFVWDLDRISAQLEALGAEIVHPRVFEQNWRFDTPDQAMNARHQLLRLRKSYKVTLTYKSSAVDVGGTSQRTEYETEVSDIEMTRNLLGALGYVITDRYEKYRAEYNLDGLYITLDELPFGNFVEIEGDQIADIQGAAADLGLDWDANITRNYLLLFKTLQKNTAIDESELTFERLSGYQITPEDLGVTPAD
ncbi:MAG: class IV adenylate cyclase [Anaerolineales bacterium]|jgi:adenylate cyclase class 2